MKYGYRVFEVHWARGARGRRHLDFDLSKNPPEPVTAKPKIKATHLSDRLETFLKELAADDATREGTPILVDVDPDDPDEETEPAKDTRRSGVPRILWDGYSRDQHHHRFRVRYGRLAEYDSGLGPTRTTGVDLTDAAPERLYRVELLLPQAGTVGLLAVETINSACPALLVLRWLASQSKLELGSDRLEKLLAFQHGDAGELDKLMTGDRAARVRLTRRTLRTDDVRESKDLEVIDYALSKSQRERLSQMAKTWASDIRAARGGNKRETDPVAAVRAMATVVDEKFADLAFTDGVVELDEGNGRFTHISPSKIDETFTYSISESDYPPGAHVWNERVSTKLSEVAQILGVQVDW